MTKPSWRLLWPSEMHRSVEAPDRGRAWHMNRQSPSKLLHTRDRLRSPAGNSPDPFSILLRSSRSRKNALSDKPHRLPCFSRDALAEGPSLSQSIRTESKKQHRQREGPQPQKHSETLPQACQPRGACHPPRESTGPSPAPGLRKVEFVHPGLHQHVVHIQPTSDLVMCPDISASLWWDASRFFLYSPIW